MRNSELQGGAALKVAQSEWSASVVHGTSASAIKDLIPAIQSVPTAPAPPPKVV